MFTNLSVYTDSHYDDQGCFEGSISVAREEDMASAHTQLLIAAMNDLEGIRVSDADIEAMTNKFKLFFDSEEDQTFAIVDESEGLSLVDCTLDGTDREYEAVIWMTNDHGNHFGFAWSPCNKGNYKALHYSCSVCEFKNTTRPPHL